jgi:hypothetical protein
MDFVQSQFGNCQLATIGGYSIKIERLKLNDSDFDADFDFLKKEKKKPKYKF